MQFSKILVPTDFSESAKYALLYAIDLAQKYGSGLHFIHVVEPIVAPVDFAWGTYSYPDIEKQMSGHVETSLARLIKNEVPSEIETESTILHGKSWREIVSFAKEKEFELIVVATHGLSGFSHALYGSTAEKVIRKAPCPVLTVRHPEVKYEMP